jgi:hypothetical protein
VKFCLRGRREFIGFMPKNGEPSRCEVRLELDQSLPLEYHRYDVQIFVAPEFTGLLEVGHAVTVTLEQNSD